MSSYESFLERRRQRGADHGFEPSFIPDELFGFQKHLVEWAVWKGRAAIFADCGLGKTFMQLAWAQNVVERTRRPALVLTPLAVASQTAGEASKFGIDAEHSIDGRYTSNIVIANYERLHYFDPADFSGVVCDESSILKNYQGQRRKLITRFLTKTPYRLLCTATAAPNDFVELGTSSEALGELSYTEMLKRFFRQLDDKGQKSETKKQDEAERLLAADPNYFKKLAYRVAQTIGQWRLKHHAVEHFWRWVSSWARALRMPSDLGFDDDGFVLPALHERDHIIEPSPPPGHLFHVPAKGLYEERQERERTLRERCEYVAGLVDHERPAVMWCHLNTEGDLLEDIVPNAAQIAGKTPDERKIELYEAFANGELQRLIIKPKIGAWGLNWQHCSDVVTFASHSYEQYYQSVRRCWRFGQKNEVTLDVVATAGEARVLENMRRKARQADQMFKSVVMSMNNSLSLDRDLGPTNQLEAPPWLSKTNTTQTRTQCTAETAST